MTKDWVEWHLHYDTPNSSLAKRLRIVHHNLRKALTEVRCNEHGVLRLISMCAGEGRDVLPVLAEQGNCNRVKALLLEIDPILSQRARTVASILGLSGVELKIADAGLTDTYFDVPPAHVLVACGVFGNITVADMHRTIATLPALLTVGGVVIWTRACHYDSYDPSLEVRTCFLDQGFTEISFSSTTDDKFRFRIGMHRLDDVPADIHPMKRGTRIFSFK
jgi:hypothetical protein